MFSLISGFLNWYFQKPTFKVLIIGEETSGKTVKKNKLNIINLDLFRTIKIYIHRTFNSFRIYSPNIWIKLY